MCVNLRLDVLMDTLLVFRILRQDLQILNLLLLNDLDKLLAHCPVLFRDLLSLVKSLNLSSFIFE